MASTSATDNGSSDPASIRLAAMNLLARREHSLGELRRKLGRRFTDASAVEEQLQRLADEGLQCDRRFAESFVRQRIQRGHGPLRIRQELRQRALDAAVVDAALGDANVDWEALAGHVLERKFGLLPAEDLHDKARRARFLQYRGFSPEHYRVLI
ncbi:MAG: regulatory protein RecX [Halioglobus sp.]|nr:regulatory protein RecX [Halioglobus sp.]